jgi:hypothetical protein
MYECYIHCPSASTCVCLTPSYARQSEEDYREKISRGCVGGCGYDMTAFKKEEDLVTHMDTRMRDRCVWVCQEAVLT